MWVRICCTVLWGIAFSSYFISFPCFSIAFRNIACSSSVQWLDCCLVEPLSKELDWSCSSFCFLWWMSFSLASICWSKTCFLSTSLSLLELERQLQSSSYQNTWKLSWYRTSSHPKASINSICWSGNIKMTNHSYTMNASVSYDFRHKSQKLWIFHDFGRLKIRIFNFG